MLMVSHRSGVKIIIIVKACCLLLIHSIQSPNPKVKKCPNWAQEEPIDPVAVVLRCAELFGQQSK